MSLISIVKNRLRKGLQVPVGSFRLNVSLSRAESKTELLVLLDLRQAQYLKQEYPFLKSFELPLNEETASEVLQAYLNLIPLYSEGSKEVAVRNIMSDLCKSTRCVDLRAQATIEIAKSDLRNGVPDRAGILVNTTKKDELEVARGAFDVAYGAPLLSTGWPEASRGASLAYYFNHHSDLIKGKRILHFSPEPELRDWIEAHASLWSIDYRTSNIDGPNVNVHQDLTALADQGPFDLIICHRVLEHVMDDRKAISELYRVLSKDGVLSTSVPQSMHLSSTAEWIVPDRTHHWHVRQYGADFISRLEAPNVVVEDVKWLLNQTKEQLLENGAYPMRMYLARKC
jgi:SAM-dependent methyltransferase